MAKVKYAPNYIYEPLYYNDKGVKCWYFETTELHIGKAIYNIVGTESTNNGVVHTLRTPDNRLVEKSTLELVDIFKQYYLKQKRQFPQQRNFKP